MYTPLVSVNMVSVRFFLVVGRFLKICNSFFLVMKNHCNFAVLEICNFNIC